MSYFKIDISDQDLNKIVRKEMEYVMENHPEWHDTSKAAEEVLGYISTARQLKKSMARLKKFRKEIYN